MSTVSTTTKTGSATNGSVELPWVHTHLPGGEPLLLVNGLSSPLVAYEDGFVAELSARGFDVVRFDNRDAGRATATQGGYQLVDQASDAVAVLDALGWQTAHVFGMSMGGMIVQQLGISFDERLRTITSLMSSTGNQKYGTSSKAARAALLEPAPLDRDAWLEQRVRNGQVWMSPKASSPEMIRAKGELLFDYGVQPQSTVHQYNAIMKSPPREDALRAVAVPTLVLHGSNDTLIHPSGGQRTAEIMPNARYLELEGMGHDLPPTYWPIIADHLLEFVAREGFEV